MVFYNKKGNAIAYTEDDIHLYLFNGEPVVYFYNEKIYGFNGKHLGWFENGWIRDLKGKCVLFYQNAVGGAKKPNIQEQPNKSIKKSIPIKKKKKRVKIKNIYHSSWSHLSGEDFLLQGI